MSKYTEKDAAKDTDVPISEVKRAWHDARDDAMAAGELNERAENKAAEAAKEKEVAEVRKIEYAEPVVKDCEDPSAEVTDTTEMHLEPVEDGTIEVEAVSEPAMETTEQSHEQAADNVSDQSDDSTEH